MICNICNIECKSLGNHLYFNHNLSSKQYYDIYLKNLMKDIVGYVKNQPHLNV